MFQKASCEYPTLCLTSFDRSAVYIILAPALICLTIKWITNFSLQFHALQRILVLVKLSCSALRLPVLLTMNASTARRSFSLTSVQWWLIQFNDSTKNSTKTNDSYEKNSSNTATRTNKQISFCIHHTSWSTCQHSLIVHISLEHNNLRLRWF